MKDTDKKVSVFDYWDYRVFLTEWFKSAKSHNPAFSHRAFAKRAGFHSSNFPLLVMQGKRNLTDESLAHMMDGLKLNKQEREFFGSLVLFNQAKTNSEKDVFYRKLIRSKKYQKLRPMERAKYGYYSAWYHPIVRELAASTDCDGTPEWIARQIDPPITAEQAAKSIALLEELGFIEKTKDGKWRQTDTIISTGPEVHSVVIHNYHKKILDLAKVMMDRLSLKDRDVSALTVGVKRERIPEIRAKIAEFRREILKLVSEDTEPEQVAQLNIQFFPTRREAGKGGGS